ncbi:DUF2326 domain-containing protein [Vibrio crassostreae]|uniref:DUF2326 domain-containing protein n=1 Tax=Vibrio crassostreae TaxID=246167 RepID=UPI001BD3CAD3|nr:DUF2326 domain-containing protein [Vibrio crassostreae]CAK1756362.1 DUF2326 domain-containing protein [Vibrio crassostreae]CAK1759081.1 DUF2326 domain-containing protein [Vibrio crassostreae]CAK2375882.1 DUF2326 domain-containing protein [Vibrio crassostreae]CAK2386710.1 DUF2326 domain-containing protein [Vibrio crassostreae]CAK2386726.1 DUF2326 domain-containing protein [Vibrio crassostreae]
MLKSISCEKLVETTLTFKTGLNSVVGADDAHNSIGKSSVLMLIDFVFGGNDFPSKCDDVIKNVKDFDVGFVFEFDKPYTFIRNTGTSDSVYHVEDYNILTIDEYRKFLQEKYSIDRYDLSFRECVSAFFRIYQRDNYNEKRPLDIVPKEKWLAIRKRVLKLFDEYSAISKLEQDKKVETDVQKDIKGTFNTGAIVKINKTIFRKNQTELEILREQIHALKNALGANVTDIKSIISSESAELKRKKDTLVDLKIRHETSLSRTEDSLSKTKLKNSKVFKELVGFFPEIDRERLSQVDSFHSGISKIMRKQLSEEKHTLTLAVEEIKSQIDDIDKELLKIVNSKEESVYLLEKLIELDRLEKGISQQNDFWEKDEKVKHKISGLKDDIKGQLVDSIDNIQTTVNKGLSKYIGQIYLDNPISPKLGLYDSDYKFDRGDDRGTGKGFANMISLDLTLLEKTCLPCIIHDSLLFKNMDVTSIENLIATYASFKKQIFISIDEVSKYKAPTKKLIDDSKFIKLSKNRVAFGIKWKNKES